MKSKIKAISYYLPDNIYTNEDLSKEFPEWSSDKVLKKTGIVERRIAGKNQTSVDLGYESALKLFNEYNILPEEIEFILFCTQSPDYLLPTSACLLQDKLGIPKNAGALDFNLGCSGYVYGLSLAKSLVEAGTVNNVLLITAETYSKLIHPKDKKNRSIFGDGAASTLIIKTENSSRIGNFVFGTDGAGYKNLIVKNGGFRNYKTDNPPIIEDDNVLDDNSLFMNGSAIFNFSLREVPKAFASVLDKNNMTIDDIDLFVFHQANDFMLEAVRRKIKIPKEKFYKYFSNIGNTVSATIPIALSDAIQKGKVQKGDKVMLVGFGVGHSWAAGIVTL